MTTSARGKACYPCAHSKLGCPFNNKDPVVEGLLNLGNAVSASNLQMVQFQQSLINGLAVQNVKQNTILERLAACLETANERNADIARELWKLAREVHEVRVLLGRQKGEDAPEESESEEKGSDEEEDANKTMAEAYKCN